ncbi:MAG: hypothetical protein QOH60_74 [Mycobacterium sp.]|jgi:hypothetical protein|nr:hypothetical protein [Mycobacterium sp.]
MNWLRHRIVADFEKGAGHHDDCIPWMNMRTFEPHQPAVVT